MESVEEKKAVAHISQTCQKGVGVGGSRHVHGLFRGPFGDDAEIRSGLNNGS